jgi:hypothetical protein
MHEHDATLDALAAIIADAIARQDTSHPVFHGCFDWHSAVHGHWALLRIARVTGRHEEAAAAAVASLRRDGLADEDAHLAREPAFEMPYGRAWFLRLAVEHDAWCRATDDGGDAHLAPMAARVADSLLAHCEAHRDGPATREYASLAWALVQLHDYLSLVGDASRLARVRRIIADDFVERDAPLSLALDAERPDFFSLFGNWAYLVARTTDAATLGAFLARHPIDDADLEPPALLGPAHHLGLPWSRAWAFAALARAAPDAADRSRFALAHASHVRAGLAVLAAHRGDYRAHDHWVPQFAVYALTEPTP